MDRQSLIGVSLVFLIFIAWYFLVKVYYKPQKQSSQEVNQDQNNQLLVKEKKTHQISSEENSLKTSGQTSEHHDQPLRFYKKGSEEKIEVETDLFKAKLSTKGATLLSFIQKQHLAYNLKPFELITDKEGATALLFKLKNGDVVSTKNVYFSTSFEPRKIVLKSNDSLKINFEALLDSVSQTKLSMSYIFRGDSYKIGFQTKFFSDNEPRSQLALSGDNYQVIWSGQLAFSEKDPEDEQNYSIAHALMGDELVDLDADDEGKSKKVDLDGITKWVSVQSKYFIASIIPKEASSGTYLNATNIIDHHRKIEIENYTVALKENFINTNEPIAKTFTLYVGPLDYNNVKSLDVNLERAMDFGWEWVTRPFAEYVIIPMFSMMERFISNYGIILIIFALIIKIVTYPLSVSQTKSMKKMSELQPKIRKLQAQYKSDPMKVQTETTKLYRESGANPFGGCLPLLLQFPVLIALFNVFRSSIQLRQKDFLWINDLSAPDILLNLPLNLPLYGDHISLLPILMAGSMVLQMKFSPTSMTPQTGVSAMQTKMFQYLFPGMMLLFFNNMPSGLSLYYFTFNVVSILQQLIMNKLMGVTKPSSAPVVSQNKIKVKEKKQLTRKKK